MTIRIFEFKNAYCNPKTYFSEQHPPSNPPNAFGQNRVDLNNAVINALIN